MAKKPRSQRRKKGSMTEGTDGGGSGTKNDGSGSGGSGGVDVDVLPDDFTLASSISTILDIEDEFAEVGEDIDANEYTAKASGSMPPNGSSSPHATAAAIRQTKLTDTLAATADILSERQSRKREAHLRRLFKAVTQWAITETARETVRDCWETNIWPCCVHGLRGTSAPSEQYAACRVLEATSVTMDGGSYNMEDYVDTIESTLRRIVMTTSRAVPVRGAALRALAMAEFICGGGGSQQDGGDDDDERSLALLHLCQSVASPSYRGEAVASSLRATALDSWGLLATTLDDAMIAGESSYYEDDDDENNNGNSIRYNNNNHNAYYHDNDNSNSNSNGEEEDDDDEDHGNGENGGQYQGVMSSSSKGLALLPLLYECLDAQSSVDMNLRAAAGECCAFIHECRLNLGITAEEGENASERRFTRGSWEGSEWEGVMEEIKERIGQLAVESGHRMSKKKKKEQRATFREFSSTLMDDESPSEVVTFPGRPAFGGRELVLDTWRLVIQLNFIRHCVQGGFQLQLLSNPTLHEMFGLSGIIMAVHGKSGSSQLEKRLIWSKTSERSKLAHVDMTKKRRNRTNVQNLFLTADGDDI